MTVGIAEKFTKQSWEAKPWVYSMEREFAERIDTPASVELVVSEGLTAAASISGMDLLLTVEGGVNGGVYDLTARVTTSSGAREEFDFAVKIKDTPSQYNETAQAPPAQSSAAQAKQSELAAAQSESNAAGSASSAASSAASASASASSSASSASSASSSASSASASASAADTKAGEASASASEAAGSASAAASSASSASGYATAAAGSATSASTSATAASNSATTAAGSASAAAASAAIVSGLFISAALHGYVGNGIADDRAAIAAAAAAANTAGLPLLIPRNTTCYINSGGTRIQLKYGLISDGVTYKFGPGRTNDVFLLEDSPLQDITALVNKAEFVKGATTIPSLAPYVNGYLQIDSNIPFAKRMPSDTYWWMKGEPGYVTKQGVLAMPIRHDYSTGGTITQVQYRADDPVLEIRGGTIDLNGKGGIGLFLCRRNNVVFKGWKVTDSTKSAEIDEAKLFRVFNCSNVVLEDFRGDAMQQAVVGQATYSYLLDGYMVFNVWLNRMFVHGGWGAFKCDYVHGYHITQSHIDRLDAHFEGWDISASSCTMYGAPIQVGCGGGYIRVSDCTKVVKDTDPFSSTSGYKAAIVGMRDDWGGCFDGDINVHDVRVVVANGFSGVLSAVWFQATGDYGAGKPLPWGQTISIRNITIEAPDAFLNDSNSRFRSLRFEGGLLYNGTTPGTLLPHSVIVENVRWSKPNVAAVITDVWPLSPSYIAAESPVMSRAMAPSTGGQRRGNNAVDLQYVRSSSYKVAAGDSSGILAGESNWCEGHRSAIAGGSENKAGSSSGTAAFVGAGTGNTAGNSNSAVVAGTNNSASALDAFIGGGRDNVANGQRSWIPGGGFGSTRSRNYSWAWSGATASAGRHQCAGISLHLETADATATVMRSDNNAASATNQLALPTDSVATFDVLVTARTTTGMNCKSWRLTGAIKNVNGVPSIIGAVTKTVIAADAAAAAWDVSATADATNKALAITVTGAAGTTIRWHARVEASEVN